MVVMENLRNYVGTPSAIIAFETAGRHMNFSRAASELNVSQPAISRQIRNLEQHIGKPLFSRRGNKIQFTEHGLILFEATNGSFKKIIAAVEQITNETRDKHLVLRSQPIVLSTFVLPLLQEFQQAFPKFSIYIQSQENTATISKDRNAISILYGDDNWPGMKSELLFNDIYFPVCQPLALKNVNKNDPEDIFDTLALLQMSEFIDPWMNWQKWGAHFDIECLQTKRPQLLNDYEMLLRSCRSGLGIAIGTLFLVEKELLEGSLVRVTNLTITSNFGFYFVYPPELTEEPGFAEILDWLRIKARETQQRCLTIY